MSYMFSKWISFSKRCESVNTMASFLWWIVGFCWVVSGGEQLLQDAPRLYRYILTILCRHSKSITIPTVIPTPHKRKTLKKDVKSRAKGRRGDFDAKTFWAFHHFSSLWWLNSIKLLIPIQAVGYYWFLRTER